PGAPGVPFGLRRAEPQTLGAIPEGLQHGAKTGGRGAASISDGFRRDQRQGNPAVAQARHRGTEETHGGVAPTNRSVLEGRTPDRAPDEESCPRDDGWLSRGPRQGPASLATPGGFHGQEARRSF